MAVDETRLFLEAALETNLKCADLRDRVNELDGAARRVTATLNGMPRSGTADRDKLLAALTDARDKLARDIAELEARKAEIAEFIDRVPTGAVGRAVLRRRYLHFEGWRGIQKWLAVHGKSYSVKSLYRIHGDAIKAARELWAQREDGVRLGV